MIIKNLFFLFFIFITSLHGEQAEIKSCLCHWNDLDVIDQGNSQRRNFIEGHTLDLGYLEIHATTLYPNQTPHPGHSHSADEEMLIVKDGKVAVTINGETSILEKNSIAVFLPGDKHSVANIGHSNATYYVFRYNTKTGRDDTRGKNAGGSFISDWKALEYDASDIGGRRQNFDRATTMFKRFEFHTSTLHAGLTNHQAHTHRAEEMVLVLKGKVEMLIGEKYLIAEAGDLYFIEANILHSLRNVGDESTEYFAFQWQ